MRYIDIKGLLRKRKRWGNRKELWKNKNLQKDYRDYFYNKCWYSEIKLLGQDAPIDHFRPKAQVKQFEDYKFNQPLANCGYYWLSNEPSNYRLCCLYANRKTGEGGKGSFFPLAENCPLMTENGGEEEKPLLIDPCNQDDVKLITFMGGMIMPASMDPLDKIRVDVSRKIYNLDDPYTKLERAKKWDNIEKVLAEYQSNNISRGSCLRQIQEEISRDSQFSACAIACVNSFAPEDIKTELDLSL